MAAYWNSTLVVGTWQHIVVTWDGSTTPSSGVKAYKNGSLITQSSTSNGVTLHSDSSNNLSLGLSTSGMDGALSDVRIYNRILTAAEVLQLYNAGG